MASDQLTQGQVDRFTFGLRAGESLDFFENGVVDVDVGPHTPYDTPRSQEVYT